MKQRDKENLQWANFGPYKWTRSVEHHGESKLMSIEHVANGTSGYT
jgi:hypothetical protein